MKKTFYSIMSSTYKRRKFWNYYNSSYVFGNELPVKSLHLSKDFLKNFLKVSGKAEKEFFDQIDNIGTRVTHSVSTFLLGHYLYQNTFLKGKIDNEINALKSKHKINCSIEFSYLWYLTCLFHDLGYNIEKDKPLTYKSYKDLEEKSKILSDVCGVPEFYTNVYKKYFDYRIKCHGKNDHGIVAGHLLFNSLCQIRKYSKNDTTSNLCWDEELEYFYNFCSWNILAHNIWFVNKENECGAKKYKGEDIKELILDEIDGEIQFKVDLNNNPFFFLFCLVDTLEPYKRLENTSDLKKVTIEIVNKAIIIISSELKCGCHETIINQAKSLDNWLIKSVVKNGKVEINLNS